MMTLPRNSSLSRPRKKASEWQSLINEYEQSSLTRKQFCATNSVWSRRQINVHLTSIIPHPVV